jgi:hypothetical protein
MKRVGKWILIAFALVIGALLGVAIFLATRSNPGPPPIAEGQLTHMDAMIGQGGRKLTAVLERRFPNGTLESDLKAVLLAQGFHSVSARPGYCSPPGQAAPNYTCLTADQDEKRKRTLLYKWENGVCVYSISIVWSADDRGGITHIEGSYNGACV